MASPYHTRTLLGLGTLSFFLAAATPTPVVQEFVPSGPFSDGSSRMKMNDSFGRLPLAFEPSPSRLVDPQVKFRARGNGYSLFLTGKDTILALRKSGARPGPSKTRNPNQPSAPAFPTPRPTPDVLKLSLAGARENASFEGLERLPGVSHYFTGNDPSKWRTNVPRYAKVRIKEVYPGVNMVYYGNQGKLEYDFEVQPGIDPRIVRLQYEGADKAELDGGGNLLLTIGSPSGPSGRVAGRTVILKAPVVYQEENGVRKSVPGKYSHKGNREIGFEVGDYDKTKPPVIDPVLDYGTYLGGLTLDSGSAIAVDASGNAYVTGYTLGDFPVTPGAAQTQFVSTIGGLYSWSLSEQAFVAKLSADGSALLYSTYLGGTGGSAGFGIAVNERGEAHVTGMATVDFPTTPGAFQTDFRGRLISRPIYYYTDYVAVPMPPIYPSYSYYLPNAFVTKLSADGSALLYSTYLGGSGGSAGYDIALDGSGKAHVTGDTGEEFPTTTGAFQTVFNDAVSTLCAYSFRFGGCLNDAFVSKLDLASRGVLDLAYSTYLGGEAFDTGNGVFVDANGDICVTGATGSADFPTTPGALQGVYGNITSTDGWSDAFVTKLKPSGRGAADLVYSTFLGGSGSEGGEAIKGDSDGNLVITGGTSSGDFPTTPGAYRQTFAGSVMTLSRLYWYYGYGRSYYWGGDLFVTKLKPSGTGAADLAYSTYLGGTNDECGFDIAVDPCGNAYVTGSTNSLDFPVTPGAFQTSFSGPVTDMYGWVSYPETAFVFELKTEGKGASDLLYSTFLGSTGGMDAACGIALGGDGGVYLVGTTDGNFPTTSGATQPDYGGPAPVTYLPWDPVLITSPMSGSNPVSFSPKAASSSSYAVIGISLPLYWGPGDVFVAKFDHFDFCKYKFPPDEGGLFVSKNIFKAQEDPVSLVVTYNRYPGTLSLKVYNSVGECVKVICEEPLTKPFRGSYTWDGTNKFGETCASGMYFFTMTGPFSRRTARILLVR